MVRLLCEDDPVHFLPCTLDRPRPDGLPNYTVDTLEQLRTKQPDVELFSIIGADSFRELPHWRSPDRLLALAEWIVVSRPGHPLQFASSATTTAPRVHHIEEIEIPIASRDLRARLQAGESCADSLPAAVIRYIRKHHLYAADQEPNWEPSASAT